VPSIKTRQARLLEPSTAKQPALFRVVESLWAQSGPFLTLLSNGPENWSVSDEPNCHLEVLDALRRRDAAAARAAIVEDIVGGGAELMTRLPD